MCVMQAGKRPLTCGYRDDADGRRCVILRHLRHGLRHPVTQPMTHR